MKKIRKHPNDILIIFFKKFFRSKPSELYSELLQSISSLDSYGKSGNRPTHANYQVKPITKILKRVAWISYRQKFVYSKAGILRDIYMSFILIFESRDSAQEQFSSGKFKTF